MNTANELQSIMNQLYNNAAFLALGAIATLTAQFTGHTDGKDYTVALMVVAALATVVRDSVNKWIDAQRLSNKLIRLFGLIYAHKNGGRHLEPPPPPDGVSGSSFSNMQVRHG